jgi:uncharacterized membrane protein (DUF106 family)
MSILLNSEGSNKGVEPVKKVLSMKKQISIIIKGISLKVMDLMNSKKLADTKRVSELQKVAKDLKSKLAELATVEKKENLTMQVVDAAIGSYSETLKNLRQKYELK